MKLANWRFIKNWENKCSATWKIIKEEIGVINYNLKRNTVNDNLANPLVVIDQKIVAEI